MAISSPWIHERERAEKALTALQFAYPIFLLVFFLSAFAARSVLTATKEDDEQAAPKVQYGPGGKPLPVRAQSFTRVVQRDFSRPRKLVFEWLSVALCLTWMGNAAVVIVHALYDREEGWWVGQAPTVRFKLEMYLSISKTNHSIDRSTSSARSSCTHFSSSRSSTRSHHRQHHILQHGSQL